ncbi:hypothetical protein BX616_006900 [Lobosporangium transversale]|nr:hypothetical protein BX616_006900 [Lobosporangium transversale]
MTFASVIRITLALSLFVLAAQTVPVPQDPSALGSMDLNAPDPDLAPTCNQDIDSGSVSLASTVNTVPITNVTPVNRYQPIVQAFAPIVQSTLYGCASTIDNPSQSDPLPRGNVLKRRQFPPINRDVDVESCSTTVPPSTVDMGSFVSAVPSTDVNPSTVYQPHVQALESAIEAAPAESSMLPQQNVDLGSNVFIQPLTQVLPQTTYQPKVQQLTTTIEATPQEDQSLPQSSVDLGSSVHIRPTVAVKPLTIFQPTVKSLPFIIEVEPCVDETEIYKPFDYGSDSAAYYGQRPVYDMNMDMDMYMGVANDIDQYGQDCYYYRPDQFQGLYGDDAFNQGLMTFGDQAAQNQEYGLYREGMLGSSFATGMDY